MNHSNNQQNEQIIIKKTTKKLQRQNVRVQNSQIHWSDSQWYSLSSEQPKQTLHIKDNDLEDLQLKTNKNNKKLLIQPENSIQLSCSNYGDFSQKLQTSQHKKQAQFASNVNNLKRKTNSILDKQIMSKLNFSSTKMNSLPDKGKSLPCIYNLNHCLKCKTSFAFLNHSSLQHLVRLQNLNNSDNVLVNKSLTDNVAKTCKRKNRRSTSAILFPQTSDSVLTAVAAFKDCEMKKIYKQNYWESFEKYTNFNYSTPLSRKFKKSYGNIQNGINCSNLSLLNNNNLETVITENNINNIPNENSCYKLTTKFDSLSEEPILKKISINQNKLDKARKGYGISILSENTTKMRCKMRKLYFAKRNKICDFSLFLAIVGLIIVFIDSELTALNILKKQDLASLLLRSICVISTLFLIWTLIDYHRIEVKIALIDSGADDWRVAVTSERLIKLGIEILICIICPFPGSGYINWPNISAEQSNIKNNIVKIPLDVLLCVPMFLRSYLLCRFMVLHSKQFQDAATRSIAALNRISMDFRFVIKTMMADHPLTVLVIFTLLFWLCMSWMFAQCERYNKYHADNYYMNSLWFIMVTFMSIGYGDVVPKSYCGRLLSITTGIVGAGVSSALIAVISRKLELSRAEKHVNNFMTDSKLTNKRKNTAASVLQHTWFIHKYRNKNFKGDNLRLRQHQQKFLYAIKEFRRIKWDLRKLQEKRNSLLDVGKLHNEMYETLWEMHRTQNQFVAQIDLLAQRIVELQSNILNGQVACAFNQQNYLPLNLSKENVSTTIPNTSDSKNTYLVVRSKQRLQPTQHLIQHQKQIKNNQDQLLSSVLVTSNLNQNNKKYLKFNKFKSLDLNEYQTSFHNIFENNDTLNTKNLINKKTNFNNLLSTLKPNKLDSVQEKNNYLPLLQNFTKNSTDLKNKNNAKEDNIIDLSEPLLLKKK